MNWESISRARRRLDGEQGACVKDWGGRLPVALVYPNSYYVGMSSLGVHVIYRLFNAHPDVVCERAFHDANEGVPVAVESQRPLGDFAVLAFSVSYELDYLNVVSILRRSSIPMSSKERDETHPLLIAGGPCIIANPEPLAPIVDAFAIGEGEVMLPALVEVLAQSADLRREDLLRQLAMIPGVYVPPFYEAQRKNGQLVVTNATESVPYPVERQWLRDLDDHPAHTAVLTDDTQFGDMYLMEVSRGCGRGCHFCLAGVAYSPVRERSPSALLEVAREGLKYRETMGLVGASLSDYSHIEKLARDLRQLGAKLSVASLRVDPLPDQLLKALSESGVQTITIAPEAGSERLRHRIRKGISTNDILRAVDLVAAYDFPQLKLYFMIGLPSEEDHDAEQIVDLVRVIGSRFHRRITVNVTPFVPKAHTPFQRSAVAPRRVLKDRLDIVKNGLRSLNVGITGESIRWAEVQGVLALGDRQAGEALLALEGTGLTDWQRALEAANLSAESYLADRPAADELPWSFISAQPRAPSPTLEPAEEVSS